MSKKINTSVYHPPLVFFPPEEEQSKQEPALHAKNEWGLCCKSPFLFLMLQIVSETINRKYVTKKGLCSAPHWT